MIVIFSNYFKCMSIKRIYAVFIRQAYLMKNNAIRLFSSFIWLFFNILLWGFITKYLGSFGGTVNFVTVILGAIILWEFTTRILHGIMTGFLEDSWSRNYINFFASPLTMGEYLSGLVLASVATGAIGFFLMAGLAGVVFGYNIFHLGLLLLPFLMVLFIFGMAMGIFVSAIIFRYGPAAEWLSWPVPFAMSIVAGVYYPVSVLPAALAYIARLIPPAYVFDSMRSLLNGGGFTGALFANLLISLALALAYLALNYYFFYRVYRRNLVNGNIAKYNAENY